MVLVHRVLLVATAMLVAGVCVLMVYVVPRLPPAGVDWAALLAPSNGSSCVCATSPAVPPSAPPARDTQQGLDPTHVQVFAGEAVHFARRDATADGDGWSFGNVLYPSHHMSGSLLVRGHAVVDGALYARDQANKLWDVGELARSLNQMADAYCPPCVNGVRHPADFECKCQCAPGWQGATCDHHTCNGRGTYSRTTRTCQCAGGWLPETYCAARRCAYEPRLVTLGVPTPPELLAGAGVDGQLALVDNREALMVYTPADACGAIDLGPNPQDDEDAEDESDVCLAPGVLGSDCAVQCAVPWPDARTCDLPNLGHSTPPGSHPLINPTFGLCGLTLAGSGVSADYTTWWGRGLDCGDWDLADCQTYWASWAGVCCAPGLRCDQRSSVCGDDDVTCCAQQTSNATCQAAGCAWCLAHRSVGASCAPWGLARFDVNHLMCTWAPRGGGLVEQALDAIAPLSGAHWVTWEYTCRAGVSLNALGHQQRCGADLRDQMALLHAWPIGDIALGVATADNLTDALADVNLLPLRSLATVQARQSGRAHAFVLDRRAVPPSLRHQCNGPPTLAIDNEHDGQSPVAVAIWACPIQDDMLWLEDSQIVRGTHVIAFHQGHAWCLLDRLMSDAEWPQATRRHHSHHHAVGHRTVAFVLADTQDDRDAACGIFDLTLTGALLNNNGSYGVGAHDTSPIATWSHEMPALEWSHRYHWPA